ncbi:MAG: hypothetical protein RLN85_16340, partial [Pseudomonadales bacterium]
ASAADYVGQAMSLISAEYHPAQSVAITPNGTGSASDRLARLAVGAFLEEKHVTVREALRRSPNWGKVKGTWSKTITMCEIISIYRQIGLPARKKRNFIVHGNPVTIFDFETLRHLVDFHSGDTALSAFIFVATDYKKKLMKMHEDDARLAPHTN